MITFILLIFGFSLLILGGNIVIDGSTSLAKKLNIPTLIIGLTIVAFGTSIPEFFVTMMSVLVGIGAFAVSDIVGSNIANSLLLVGIAMIIRPIKTKSNVIHKMLLWLIGFSALFLFLADKQLIFNNPIIHIGKVESTVLVAVFMYFLYTLITHTIKLGNEQTLTEGYKSFNHGHNSIFFITFGLISGLVLLILGAKLVVDNALIISRNYGLSETFIGLTVLTLGTSLPELVTIIIASIKDEGEVVLGNIIGSNIFNIAIIIGLAGLIGNLTAHSILRWDTIFMLVISIVLYFVATKRGKYSRLLGYQFIGLYIIYILTITIRG